jgi:1-acyl-sn-glycerol-3-phosphate acyltransferase
MLIPIILTVVMLVIGISVIVLGTPLVMLVRLLDPSGKTAHDLARWWLATLSKMVGTRITVEGRENLDPKRPCLILANHKSAHDILVLARVLPLHFKFFADHKLFSKPFFGWCMTMAGYLPINRSNRTQARASIIKGTGILRDGRASLLIFPEGTRCERPVIQKFKYGFLRIATEARRPLQPVILDGTEKAKPKSSFWFRPAHVHVSILPAEPVDRLARENWDEEKTRFEETFRREYQRIHALSTSSSAV